MSDLPDQAKVDVYKAFLEQIVRSHFPQPHGSNPRDDVIYFTPEMKAFFEELREDERKRIMLLTKINPAILKGLGEMSEKEWASFMKSIDFLATSSTAVKVISLCLGACITTLLTVFGLMKAGYDIFSVFKGPPQ